MSILAEQTLPLEFQAANLRRKIMALECCAGNGAKIRARRTELAALEERIAAQAQGTLENWRGH